MPKTYRIVDLRMPNLAEQLASAASPEAAMLDALGVDAVRSGSKRDLIAKVYWQIAPTEPTNMVRMYRRLDPERANRDREKPVSPT